ncbi:MAG: 4Fe-4S dicluster domain-containing protein [Chitinivibrionales bacterium]|nr:4Fe-4S dicluster domain-containing protein [Chitinivibrionales bacterium]
MINQLSRRSFVRRCSSMGLGVGAAALIGQAADESEKKQKTKSIRNFRETMAYREVGSTGINVSSFSMGTGQCSDEVLNAALDKGINLFHTCVKYSGGKSIETVARVIRGKTGKVHIALKDTFSSLEETLKVLGVGSIDFVMFNRHNADKFRKEIPDIKKRFLQWRDKGMVKYAGLTTHKQMGECIDVALETDFISCVMPSYSPSMVDDLKKQRDALRRKNISIIAMKTRGQLDDEQYPSQVQTVLSDPVVCTVTKGVKTIDDLKSWSSAAANARSGFLNRYLNSEALAYSGCGLCGKCEEACPENIPVADYIRCIRYYVDSEKTPDIARETFDELHLQSAAAGCTDCGACSRACPQRIAVRAEVRRTLHYFGSTVAA